MPSFNSPEELAAIKSRVDGLISIDEGRALAELASTVEDNLAIVEIGAYKGLSTSYLALGNSNSRIFSIDLWDTTNVADVRIKKKKKRKNFDDSRVFSEYLKNVKALRNVIPVRGDSREIGKVWYLPIGLLFIDGAHDYESVKSDMMLFAGSVEEGGYMCFHDAAETKGKVGRVLEEFVRSQPSYWDDQGLVGRMAIFQRKYTDGDRDRLPGFVPPHSESPSVAQAMEQDGDV